jgi:hypothetical protein
LLTVFPVGGNISVFFNEAGYVTQAGHTEWRVDVWL